MIDLKRFLTVQEVAWLVNVIHPHKPLDPTVNQLRNFTKKGLFGELPKIGDGLTAAYGYSLEAVVAAMIFVVLADAFGTDAVRLASVKNVLGGNLDADAPGADKWRGSPLGYVIQRVSEGDAGQFLALHTSVEGETFAGRITSMEQLFARASYDFWLTAPSVVLPIGAFVRSILPISAHIDLKKPIWNGARQ